MRWYAEHYDKTNPNPGSPGIDISKWTVFYDVVGIPKQRSNDKVSCGVYAAMTAYYYIRHKRFPTTNDFDAHNLPALRLLMAHTLLVFHTNLSIYEYDRVYHNGGNRIRQ